jgi:hypothetical protein
MSRLVDYVLGKKEVEVTPSLYDGWADYVTSVISLLARQPDIYEYTTVDNIQRLNYDLRLYPILQAELERRTGQQVTCELIQECERHAMKHADYYNQLAYNLLNAQTYIMQKQIERKQVYNGQIQYSSKFN